MARSQPSALLARGTAGRSSKFARHDHVHSSLGIMQRLFTLAANFNVTTDQAFLKAWEFTDYEIAMIRARNASLSLTTAAGGIYTAASKGGSAIVASGQAYSGITGTGLGIDLTIAAAGRALLSATPILSLTTAQGAAATGTIEIWGIPVSAPAFD